MAITFKEYALQSWSYNGESAKCIYGFARNNKQELNYPHDPDDLCRCIQVLRLLFRNDEQRKINLLKEIGEFYDSKHYKVLADNYCELIDLFESEWDSKIARKTYNFMNKIYNE